MIFVDVRNPRPLYEQIKESVRSQMVRGILTLNDKLPSVRELAQSAAINPNTIQKAYRDLEAEGLIYTVPGRGCFVAEFSEDARKRRRKELLETIRPFWIELSFFGASDEEICQYMKGGTTNDD